MIEKSIYFVFSIIVIFIWFYFFSNNISKTQISIVLFCITGFNSATSITIAYFINNRFIKEDLVSEIDSLCDRLDDPLDDTLPVSFLSTIISSEDCIPFFQSKAHHSALQEKLRRLITSFKLKEDATIMDIFDSDRHKIIELLLTIRNEVSL